MLRITGLLRLVVVAGLVSGAACNGGSSVAGNGGASGRGGAGGTGGAAPITSCPAAPTESIACDGAFTCQYNHPFCRCGGYLLYGCTNGSFTLSRHDTCLPDDLCGDGGAGSGGSSVGGRGGAGGTGADASTAAVCTFGADQTCNDDPRVSSIHGRCTDAGACVCGDAGTNADSGRCL